MNKLEKWWDSISPRQRQDIAAHVGLTQWLLVKKLHTDRKDFRVREALTIANYAKSSGFDVTIEDDFQ